MTWQTVIWRRYSTGVVHAWLPGECRSACRLVECADGPGRITPDPDAKVCARCRSSIRRAITEPRHIDDDGCACRRCRQHRQHHATDFASTILREPGVCRCVVEWPRTTEYVDAAFAAMCAAVLAWEMSDTVAAARDAEEAGRELRDAWRRAAAEYDRVDGTHHHAPADEARG